MHPNMLSNHTPVHREELNLKTTTSKTVKLADLIYFDFQGATTHAGLAIESILTGLHHLYLSNGMSCDISSITHTYVLLQCCRLQIMTPGRKE